MEDDTYCKECGGLIATPHIKQVKLLKRCSFPIHIIRKCNDCATIGDMTDSLKYYKEAYPKGNTSTSPEQFKQIMKELKQKYPQFIEEAKK